MLGSTDSSAFDLREPLAATYSSLKALLQPIPTPLTSATVALSRPSHSETAVSNTTKQKRGAHGGIAGANRKKRRSQETPEDLPAPKQLRGSLPSLNIHQRNRNVRRAVKRAENRTQGNYGLPDSRRLRLFETSHCVTTEALATELPRQSPAWTGTPFRDGSPGNSSCAADQLEASSSQPHPDRLQNALHPECNDFVRTLHEDHGWSYIHDQPG